MNTKWNLVWGLLVLMAGTSAWAADPPRRIVTRGEYNPAHPTVEMFDAADEGSLEVRFIPKDVTEGTILITNTSDEPLNVRLPEAFAAVPALGQCGLCGLCGGCGGGGAQAGGGGGGGGVFNVPPNTTGKISVPFVCLEHGKGNPRPAIPYKIMRADEYNDDPVLGDVLALMGSGKLSQRSAQAAAWHLANEMSWQELAAKQIRRANGTRYPFFSQQELQRAIDAVAQIKKRHDDSSLSESDRSESDR